MHRAEAPLWASPPRTPRNESQITAIRSDLLGFPWIHSDETAVREPFEPRKITSSPFLLSCVPHEFFRTFEPPRVGAGGGPGKGRATSLRVCVSNAFWWRLGRAALCAVECRHPNPAYFCFDSPGFAWISLDQLGLTLIETPFSLQNSTFILSNIWRGLAEEAKRTLRSLTS